MKVAANTGDTLDLICWRELGSESALEEAAELNPGLADLGPLIPSGTLVTLPDALSATATPALQSVQLWD